MKWKISKIEVSSFKAFKHIFLDLGDSSLLTLDGPNGYGKTSIFDAIELLLTGQINRIQNLFSTLLTRNKRDYADNLFWNNRSAENDLCIKIEFINDGRKLVLARHCPVATFKKPANNRADKYENFQLYELPEFESSDFTKKNHRENNFLDEVFGKNFRENFPFLNYLEQGQNRLLHTRVDERKEKLGNLFNISDIEAEIESCNTIHSKLTKHINDPERKAQVESLKEEIATLRGTLQTEAEIVGYKRLSTTDVQPGWDKESLFSTYSSADHTTYQESVRKITALLPLKATIKTRVHNETIDADIVRNEESLRSLVKFGKDLGKLDGLEAIKKVIDDLERSASIIKRGSTVIKLEEARTLPNWANGRLDWFESKIESRNILRDKNDANANVVAELERLKGQLLDEHKKSYPNDQFCPLCGADWEDHKSMVDSIEARTKQISESLGQDGRDLVNLIAAMDAELKLIDSHIQDNLKAFKPKFEPNLHAALIKIKLRLPAITQLLEKLQNENIQLTYSFTENDEVVDERLEKLKEILTNKKQIETDALALPEDWRETTNSAFKDLQDFYIVTAEDLKYKEQYISIKANEAQNSRLQTCITDLQLIEKETLAAKRAQSKIENLRSTLKKTEQRYTDQTISAIEFIFHIYSGRLIQNYQRGLGLFIESREGTQLRFLTAEKSEHDAVMSMSSGQVSALSLAFFLSLNKVYARVPLILIDDPSQSLDEVNVASLTDLLRCELKHCQLVVSSHEDDISAYMRYRFDRAGLTTSSLNMQFLAKEAS
ncbi:TPA: AAA family ATPase [Pseudomonas aeruginosa]|uniref:AAA family ATPase n=1 Tax=Pseudomonas aeruginosa TaxID=287 RepID=UPI00106B9CAF|nr:AAA family ATPase [Pseudomonas aeruginosa]HCI3983308.1 AAA family ATPase [Pseudomonas aeruginosa]HEN8461269.1 AAA family ATPase [Pseudomonas aeruginosa]HEN8467008.1 AAA family ATPase [Pseudomonas aeruginosa]HEN8577668.1 AAA family ATPase [Pseudomonas aeruginosa]HEN8829850.1 AAA family ATPase [Pseudomonas aeruginosa]